MYYFCTKSQQYIHHILHSTEENLKDLPKELPKNIRPVIETVESEEYD
jgi:hypothetical protein